MPAPPAKSATRAVAVLSHLTANPRRVVHSLRARQGVASQPRVLVAGARSAHRSRVPDSSSAAQDLPAWTRSRRGRTGSLGTPPGRGAGAGRDAGTRRADRWRMHRQCRPRRGDPDPGHGGPAEFADSQGRARSANPAHSTTRAGLPGLESRTGCGALADRATSAQTLSAQAHASTSCGHSSGYVAGATRSRCAPIRLAAFNRVLGEWAQSPVSEELRQSVVEAIARRRRQLRSAQREPCRTLRRRAAHRAGIRGRRSSGLRAHAARP